LDITKEQFLGLLWLAGCHPAPDEAATRDKALEDAALLCDSHARLTTHSEREYSYRKVAAAIRQMKRENQNDEEENPESKWRFLAP